ncbi:hypothetical protein GCM10018980_51830 [Streptomyces capoamus]|uniref:Uncharacterized protein n=1 Tax=Streptomyces capoamus TaxID=68183 RepID=A0A919EZP3_9ACTN|nr:hypothetical protein [Streptomyces capoamus]GGW15753.1 hypothetical protein GCM10010501_28980 [Streptomyces libani subsp. rufus]GHG62144.1 hypothetical protein GCM10018980_51830 [Streptomyces capoamus]
MVNAWATTQQVIDTTGVSVTDAQLAQAQDDIEIFTNRVYADTPRIRTRDLYWLGRAVARQAAWIAGQFGLETRLDATQIQQDQVSTTLQGDGLVLAPMAKRALQRVSWMRSRTVHVRSAVEGAGPLLGDPLSDGSDDSLVWAPYTGGP